MSADLGFGQPPERRDNQAIAHLRSPSGGAIHKNLTTARWAWYRVRFEAFAVVEVPYVHTLKRSNAGTFQQICIHGH